MDKQNVLLEGPCGQLEGLLELPDEAPRAIAVVCHPHPLHQGTMLNKVAHTLARAMLDVKAAVLRFNFRGVGSSAGSYGDGLGEVDDALAAVAWLRQCYPRLPLYLTGFSFGGRIALCAAPTAACDVLVTIAPAVTMDGYPPVEQPRMPWLVVQGGADEIVPCDDVVNWVDSLEPGPELAVLDDVNHFFDGKLTPMRNKVVHFMRRHGHTFG